MISLSVGIFGGECPVQRRRSTLRRRAHHLHLHRGPDLRERPQYFHQTTSPGWPLRQAAPSFRQQMDHDQRSHLRLRSAKIPLIHIRVHINKDKRQYAKIFTA